MSRSDESNRRAAFAGAALLVVAGVLFTVYAIGQWQHTTMFVRAWLP